MYRHLSLLSFRFTLLQSLSPTNAMDLVLDGQTSATVVVPDEALPVVTFAAEELVYHVQRATGAKLPVAKESERPTGGKLVFIGGCQATAEAGISTAGLPPNGFIVKLIDDRFYLVGDDSDGPPAWILHNNRTRVGSLFAVYEFLEEHLQVRWLWPGELGEVIPHHTAIVLDAWDQTGAPALIHTRWRDGGQAVAGTIGWSSGQSRSRFLSEPGKWLRRNRFAMGVNMDMAHAFTDWWDRHKDDHPEYFNLLPDGTRRSDPFYHGGASRLISMCVSEPGFHKAIVDDWRQRRSPFDRQAHEIFTPAAMARGRELMDRAVSAVRGDDTAEQRVMFLEKGLRNAELTLAAQAAYARYRETGSIRELRSAIEGLDGFRRSVERDLVCNMGYLVWAEGRTWDRELLQNMKTPGQRLPDPWQFMWDPKNRGIQEDWFAEDVDSSVWLNIAADRPWEEQPVGKQWRQEHGTDYDGVAWYMDEECSVIEDGGFERQPAAWRRSVMCGEFAFELDNEHAHSGAISARLHCTKVGTTHDEQKLKTRAWGRWYQTGVPVDKGKTYRLRLWAKTSDDFAGTVAIWVTGDAKQGTVATNLVNTGGLWHPVTATGITPISDTVGIYLNVRDGTGTAWFDDVELVPDGQAL